MNSVDVNIKIGVSGHFVLHKWQADDEGNPIPGTREKLAEFDNLVLDGGLERMGTNSYAGGCSVGSGNSTPVVTQTALDIFVAGFSSVLSDTISAQGVAPYYGKRTKTFRFNTGVAAGNLTEVGIGNTGTSDGTDLFSRALIVDGSGVPTTITILPTEILDVTYELRFYANPSDVTSTALINGISTDILIRSAKAASAGDDTFNTFGYGVIVGKPPQMYTSSAAYTGDISATITGQPSGQFGNTTSSEVDGNISGAYVGGSYTRQFFLTVNVGTDRSIRSLVFDTSYGSYQLQFTPAVVKTSTQQAQFRINVSWTRRAI